MLEIDDSEQPKLVHEQTTSTIIGAAFEVRAQLGYGFRERVYQSPLPAELPWRGATAELEKRVQVQYKGVIVEDDDADVLVDNSVAVENQSSSAVRQTGGSAATKRTKSNPFARRNACELRPYQSRGQRTCLLIRVSSVSIRG